MEDEELGEGEGEVGGTGLGMEVEEDWERIWSFLGARLVGVGFEGVVAARAEAKRRFVALDHWV